MLAIAIDRMCLNIIYGQRLFLWQISLKLDLRQAKYEPI